MTIWTLGHSNHDWPNFANLLALAGIEVLGDVRSSPSSRTPHFNQSQLRSRLAAARIEYVFLGAELGGRPSNGSAADYEAMATEPSFLAGLDKVEAVASSARLALMCSEHEPLHCHRCLLVVRRLVERGVEVAHILRDERIEPHQGAEDRLLRLTKLSEADLLASRADRLALAYRAQNQRLWRTNRTPAAPRPGRRAAVAHAEVLRIAAASS